MDALKFVGILKEGPIIWALIKQPDGLVSRVKPGDYIGQNYGQIMRIEDKTVHVEEAIQASGNWEKRRITINLSVPD